MKATSFKFSLDSIHVLLDMIKDFIQDTSDVEDGKDMLWRFLLYEIHKRLMRHTIEIEDWYTISFPPYQALALYQLFEEFDFSKRQWDDYQLLLYNNMYKRFNAGMKVKLLTS